MFDAFSPHVTNTRQKKVRHKIDANKFIDEFSSIRLDAIKPTARPTTQGLNLSQIGNYDRPRVATAMTPQMGGVTHRINETKLQVLGEHIR